MSAQDRNRGRGRGPGEAYGVALTLTTELTKTSVLLKCPPPAMSRRADRVGRLGQRYKQAQRHVEGQGRQMLIMGRRFLDQQNSPPSGG